MRLEYWIIAIFMLFMVVMGYVQKKLNKDTSDYFRSGCRGTWWLVGASAFMGNISAYTFTAAAGVAFESGWSVLIIYLSNALSCFLAFLFFAPWFRQLRVITAPDIIGMRFNEGTKQFYAWISVIQYAVLAGLPLYALALFCAAVFQLNIYMVIAIIGGVVVFYSTIGGKWAVMSNDFVQCLILLSVTILIAFLCLYKVGGIGGFLELIKERGLQEDFRMIASPGRFAGNRFTWAWAIAIFINANFAQNTVISASKYFSVKDGREARKAALFTGVLLLLGSAIWFLPPMTARLLFEQEVNRVAITNPAEAAYAVVSMQFLPPSLVGLVVVAMFAATMSTLDVGINGNAAIMVKNIYPAIAKIFRWKLFSEKKQMVLSQLCTVLMGLGITAFALAFALNKQKGIFEILLTLTALVNLPLALPMMLCLFVRNVPVWSAVFTIVISFVASITAFFSKELFGQEWTFQQQFFTILVVGTVAFLVTMFFWHKASEAYKIKVNEFFHLMHKPIDFTKEVGLPLDVEQFRTIGFFTVALGVFVCGLLFISREHWSRGCIIFVAGFMISIGLIMMYFGRKLLMKSKAKIDAGNSET
jgi:Na+/proline symporter